MFLKDLLTRKKQFDGVETVAFTEECCTRLQSKSPPKLKDPGSYSIPCTIGTLLIDKALCDSGASVSVIPYSVYKTLNMGKLKCTGLTLQMADRSIKRPLGILEDVPVKIGKFFFPVDFVVLDMAEDTRIPIILGRPFLKTAGAVIDMENDKLTLKFGDDKVTFSLTKDVKGPMIDTSFVVSDLETTYSNDDSSVLDVRKAKSKSEDDIMNVCAINIIPPSQNGGTLEVVSFVFPCAGNMKDAIKTGLGEQEVGNTNLVTTGHDKKDGGKRKRPPRVKKSWFGVSIAGFSSILWTNPIPTNQVFWRPKVNPKDHYGTLGSEMIYDNVTC